MPKTAEIEEVIKAAIMRK